MLLSEYASDDEDEAEAAVEAPSARAPVVEAPRPKRARPESHGRLCECPDCASLLARFCGRQLQVRGLRFRCRLCGAGMARKDEATSHFLAAHGEELQLFKRHKEPFLFEAAGPEVFAASFKREAVLGRRRSVDEDGPDFGGWARKEKPEPPPCESLDYQLQLLEAADSSILSAAPWSAGPRPQQDDASATDLEVDAQIRKAQLARFCKRNVLPVRADSVRCKLCYKTLAGVHIAEKHVIDTHQAEFEKEGEIWNRFLYTSTKRQPPFGWCCKICNLFFPTDGSVWRHLGKEVFIRHDSRHADLWHEKEDRWGHEEDEECCGDGMNVSGRLSYDSVKLLNSQLEEEAAQKAAREAGLAGKPDESDDEAPEGDGRAVPITEF